MIHPDFLGGSRAALAPQVERASENLFDGSTEMSGWCLPLGGWFLAQDCWSR